MQYARKQSHEQSCGAAALMVALAEMELLKWPETEIEKLSLEDHLWNQISVTIGKGRWSLPGLISIEATRHGADVAVLQDTGRLSQLAGSFREAAIFDVPELVEYHEVALDRARSCGIRVLDLAASRFPGAMVAGVRLLTAFALSMDGGGITLHWMLFRRSGDVIWTMDPSIGNNRPIPSEEFDGMFRRTRQLPTPIMPTPIGVAVLMRPDNNAPVAQSDAGCDRVPSEHGGE